MITPKSIHTVGTESFEQTWHDRLQKLNIEQLLIDIETERDPIKLEYWLEMLGIDTSIFDFSRLDEAQRKLLMTNWIDILMHSGTEYSIKNMAKVLGASGCDIFYGGVLHYDGSALHNGLYYYDAGTLYSRFSIQVHVYGVPVLERPLFDVNFRKLMRAVQPVRIHLLLLDFL